MKIGWWNIRGFTKALKHKVVHSFLKEQSLSIFALLETKLDDGKLLDIVQLKFSCWKVVHNCEEHEGGRIVVFWDPVRVLISQLSKTDQVIHLLITCLVTGTKFYTSFVYGKHSIVARRPMWDTLRDVGKDGKQPWLVMGDFNSALQEEDRLGQSQKSAYATRDFQDCCLDLGLEDLRYMGAKYTWTNGHYWSKIDRALCNQPWLIEGLHATAHFLPPGCVSDHSPCVVSLFEVAKSPKKNFMFFNMWADHMQFKEIVKQGWAGMQYGTKQYIMCRKLKLLKKPLKDLNRQEFSHIAERARRAREELKKQQMLLQGSPQDVRLKEMVHKLYVQANSLTEAERKFCCQQTKVEFLMKGDKGTKLFHSLIKRNSKKNFIASVRKEDGSFTTSKVEVQQEFLNFYTSLLGTYEGTGGWEQEVIEDGPIISEIQAEMLLAPFSKEDIKMALNDIGNEKSPGPDGYTAYFFKKAWDVVGEDFCATILEFFQTGKLLKQLNHCAITLIPKNDRAEAVGDYRPISCCNVIYKVITKLLADRLAKVLPHLIDAAQSGFVKDRLMVENIHLAQEIMRGYGRKRTAPKCTLKIDIRKAYDTISWEFLRAVLTEIRMPRRFVDWILECVTTASYSIKINGDLVGFFKGRRGLRQGDPMSPSLFVLCMEYLSRSLNRVTRRYRRGAYKFHPKCEPLRISHLAFADDLMVFARGDLSSVKTVWEAIQRFGKASGLHVNNLKSDIFLAGVDEELKQEILTFTGFSKGQLPFRYLGIPLSGEYLNLNDYAPMLNKISGILRAWGGMCLSYAGRIEVLKAVIQGIQSFWLGILPISTAVADRMTAMCRRFLWGEGQAKVAWQTLCHSKAEGGIGLRDIKAWNNALLVKTLWNLQNKKDTLWNKWMHHIYLKQGSLWTYKQRRNDPPMMKKLMGLRDRILMEQGGGGESYQPTNGMGYWGWQIQYNLSL